MRNRYAVPLLRLVTVYEVAFASPGALSGMSAQLPQSASPAFCWTWYFVMLASFGLVQASETCAFPAVAVRPVGFAGLLVLAGAVSFTATVSPSLQLRLGIRPAERLAR